MSKLFEESTRDNFTGIENWDVSNVTNMILMFHEVANFNENISRWNVSNVKDMTYMFSYAESFNQDEIYGSNV